MSPAAWLWLLEKVRADLLEAKEEERAAKRAAVEMMKRQRGEDGWDPEPWRGEGTKARREYAAAVKRRKMLDGLVKEFGAMMTKRGRRR